MGRFLRSVGIDLGTANTLILVQGKNIVLREPSVVAVDKKDGEIVAVGNAAKDMLGRTPDSIIAIRPLRDGVIADFNMTQGMLKHFVNRSISHSWFLKPIMIVCIPYGATPVEKRAVEEVILQAGAGSAYLIQEPLAAAIGTGISVNEPSGNMVVDIGGGTSEVAVISLGTIVVSKSIRIAGDKFDESIIRYVRRHHDLIIGERTAEYAKMELGSIHNKEENKSLEIRGRHASNGLPKTALINAREVNEALKEPIEHIIDAIKVTLEKSPPELAADIIQKGMSITGGGSLLSGLTERIMESIGIKAELAENPLDCVINGIEKIIEDMQSFKRVLIPLKK